MKRTITRKYTGKCQACGGYGIDVEGNLAIGVCKVCHGSGIIEITETYEEEYFIFNKEIKPDNKSSKEEWSAELANIKEHVNTPELTNQEPKPNPKSKLEEARYDDYCRVIIKKHPDFDDDVIMLKSHRNVVKLFESAIAEEQAKRKDILDMLDDMQDKAKIESEYRAGYLVYSRGISELQEKYK